MRLYGVSPDGASMALPYLVAEWSEVCLFEGVKEVFCRWLMESPSGANMALPYLMAEWSEVCLFGGGKRGFCGQVDESPDGANARGAFVSIFY